MICLILEIYNAGCCWVANAMCRFHSNKRNNFPQIKQIPTHFSDFILNHDNKTIVILQTTILKDIYWISAEVNCYWIVLHWSLMMINLGWLWLGNNCQLTDHNSERRRHSTSTRVIYTTSTSLTALAYHLTHITHPPPGQNGRHFCRRHFQMHFLEWKW